VSFCGAAAVTYGLRFCRHWIQLRKEKLCREYTIGPAVLLIATVAAGAEKIKVDKTDAVGRRIENEYFVADLSEDSGTLRALTYKPFGVTFFRNPQNGRMHKGISCSARAPRLQGYRRVDACPDVPRRAEGGIT